MSEYSPIDGSQVYNIESPFGTPQANDSNSNEQTVCDRYETSTPINMKTEAALCYLLGPITGFLWLIIEVKNDYVRFHAWQSSLVFSFMLALHLLLVWSKILSRLLLLSDFFLMGFLMYHAWNGADDLTCVRIPILGPYAALWVEEEDQSGDLWRVLVIIVTATHLLWVINKTKCLCRMEHYY